jgi:hypothetical protein
MADDLRWSSPGAPLVRRFARLRLVEHYCMPLPLPVVATKNVRQSQSQVCHFSKFGKEFFFRDEVSGRALK